MLESEMPITLGEIESLFLYPVKSMRGVPCTDATLGWHGLDGDRRFAFRRLRGTSGFPWLTASKLPELILFAPHRIEDGSAGDLPTHVRTPDGADMPLFGDA